VTLPGSVPSSSRGTAWYSFAIMMGMYDYW
jgi:hypothetical protein